DLEDETSVGERRIGVYQLTEEVGLVVQSLCLLLVVAVDVERGGHDTMFVAHPTVRLERYCTRKTRRPTPRCTTVRSVRRLPSATTPHRRTPNSPCPNGESCADRRHWGASASATDHGA